MEPTVRRLFDIFVSNANMQMLHPLDMARFHRFVAAAEIVKDETSWEEVEKMVRAAGFTQGQVNRLTTIYEQGRLVLRAAPEAASELARLRLQ